MARADVSSNMVRLPVNSCSASASSFWVSDGACGFVASALTVVSCPLESPTASSSLIRSVEGWRRLVSNSVSVGAIS